MIFQHFFIFSFINFDFSLSLAVNRFERPQLNNPTSKQALSMMLRQRHPSSFMNSGNNAQQGAMGGLPFNAQGRVGENATPAGMLRTLLSSIKHFAILSTPFSHATFISMAKLAEFQFIPTNELNKLLPFFLQL